MTTTVPEPATREAAISLVVAANRGDVAAVTAQLDDYDAVGEFVAALHATLALARALAVQLRSPQGLMACDAWLAETSREHPSRDTRIAAALILGHAMTRYPPTETVTVAETYGEMYNVGASTFNAVCCEADERITAVFAAALVLWHHLLPELVAASGPCMIGNTAGQLWGGAAEPTPPKLEGTPTTLRARMKAEDSPPPQPALSIPRECEVVRRPPAPRIPAGAVINLRGLGELRRREAQE
jgi:hypothetical protein